MEIIYTCPKCGTDLIDVCLTTNPPQYRKQCMNCGWRSDINMQEKDFIRIPYPTKDKELKSYTTTSIPSSCVNCPNHPSNGGSGICHCILGTPVITASSDVTTSSDVTARLDGSWSIDIETRNQN